MKIQYISCHAVLEYDEVKLLTELGHEVYANGVYRDPRGAHTLPRPGIPGAKFDQAFFDATARTPKTKLTPDLIEPFDVIIIMSGDSEQPLMRNWENIKHKRVIWRTIGQTTPRQEAVLKKYKEEGLEIVRYSPKEYKYTNFAGGDKLIRFYKDPEIHKDWTGEDAKVVNFSQTLKGRGAFIHYDEIMGSIAGFDAMVYGSGNNDLGLWNGGEIPYQMMLEVMRKSRVMVYGGTWPACYTLSLIEAMMTGMPVVALGKNMVQKTQFEQFNYYEIEEIIEHGVSGFIGHSIQEMRGYIEQLLNDHQLAKEISANARARAIELFGKEKISKQWDDFLKGNNDS